MEFINDNLTAIIIALIGVVGLSIGITIRIRKGNSNRVVQKNNRAGGNISGRDTITKKKNGK